MRFMICCYCRRLVFHLLLGTFVTFVSCFSRLYDSRRPALHIATTYGEGGLLTDGELLNADDHEFSSFTHTHTQPPPRELIDLKRMSAILSLSLYSLSSSLLFVRRRVPFVV